jgi:hypothetical protein
MSLSAACPQLAKADAETLTHLLGDLSPGRGARDAYPCDFRSLPANSPPPGRRAHHGPSVHVRVAPGRLSAWHQHPARLGSSHRQHRRPDHRRAGGKAVPVKHVPQHVLGRGCSTDSDRPAIRRGSLLDARSGRPAASEPRRVQAHLRPPAARSVILGRRCPASARYCRFPCNFGRDKLSGIAD